MHDSPTLARDCQQELLVVGSSWDIFNGLIDVLIFKLWSAGLILLVRFGFGWRQFGLNYWSTLL